MARSVGVLVGCILGGILADKFQTKIDWFLVLGAAISGVAMAAVPWMPNLVLLGINFSLQGFAFGLLSPSRLYLL